MHRLRRWRVATGVIAVIAVAAALWWCLSVSIRDTNSTALLLARGKGEIASSEDRIRIMPSDTVIVEVPLRHAAREKAHAYDFAFPKESLELGRAEPITVDLDALAPVTSLSTLARQTRVARTVDWGRAQVEAAEYATPNGTMIVLVSDRGESGLCSVYQVVGQDVRRVFNAGYGRSVLPGLLTCAVVRIVPPDAVSEAPAILEFTPPLGVARWEWNGHDFALRCPHLADVPTLAVMVWLACRLWFLMAAAAIALWALGFRHMMRASFKARHVIGILVVCLVLFLGTAIIVSSMEVPGWITGGRA